MCFLFLSPSKSLTNLLDHLLSEYESPVKEPHIWKLYHTTFGYYYVLVKLFVQDIIQKLIWPIIIITTQNILSSNWSWIDNSLNMFLKKNNSLLCIFFTKCLIQSTILQFSISSLHFFPCGLLMPLVAFYSSQQLQTEC